ncbi:MAG: DUF2911 domain-containing protein [Bacteroidota bacterium]
MSFTVFPHFFYCCLFLLFSYGLQAQEAPLYPPLSGQGRLEQQVGFTRISIEYERPSARGRTIYGGLVPWGEVWRTGAGYCTRISFDADLSLGGQVVPAGNYSLLSIPMPEEWVIILNKDTTLYGAYDYRPDLDAARFRVPSTRSHRYYETLTIGIDLIPNDARLYISWTDVQVSFPIETGVDSHIMENIKQLLAQPITTDPWPYDGAADYLFYKNRNLNWAIQLADLSLEIEPEAGFPRRLKMEIYERMHRYEKAMEVALEAIENRQQHPFASSLETRTEIASWERAVARIRKAMED